ncbi:site-specific DNA-methyltransferase [Nakamurella sp. A5-74]|uniref:Site-specific DNA-methyltransferase n=1 Tax=Nakamurella sp. A5-74 TaxID=3158264 RepID=A0AAU8DP72_9ACTN
MGQQQRLALSWFNKDKALLPLAGGGYEWVERDDTRVTEVRLLRERTSVGAVVADETANLVIQGDAYDALHSLRSIAEYRREYAGQVKLAYIDPPFNTEQIFGEFYDDNFDHSVWLAMFRDRVRLLRELLAANGSIWVHLDDAEVHRARMVLDEEFGIKNFVAEVVWEKADSPNNSASFLSKDQDVVLVYAKDKAVWRPNRLPRSAAFDVIYTNPDGDPRGSWYPGDPFANKTYSRGLYAITGPSGRTFRPPKGRFWRISEEKFWELERDDRIFWGPDQTARPSIKRYLSEVEGLTPRTLWRQKDVGSNRTSKNEMRYLFPDLPSFATPKPERFMQRVLQMATAPGDIVIDCFGGSGTTAAVAHKMGRRWVTVETMASTVSDYILPRLSKVVAGTDEGGITWVKERVPADGVDLPAGVSSEEAKDFQAVLRRVLEPADPSDVQTGAKDVPVFADALDDHSVATGPLDLVVDLPKEMLAALKAAGDDSGLKEEEAAQFRRLMSKLTVKDVNVRKTVQDQLNRATRTRDRRTQLWEGGGGFRVLDVEPAKAIELNGRVFLRENIEALPAYVAAQIGYTLTPKRRGVTAARNRDLLVVVEGLVDAPQIAYVVSLLAEGETVTVAGLAVHPEAQRLLADQRPGSRILKVPADLHRKSKVIR